VSEGLLRPLSLSLGGSSSRGGNYTHVIPISWRFYVTASGNKIVQRELDGLSRAQKAQLIDLMRRHGVQELHPRELESVGGGLLALRTTVERLELRLYFAQVPDGDEVICLALRVLHKQSRKIPKHELDLVRDRLRDSQARQPKRRGGAKLRPQELR
jgi:phage-related protein